ncbi:hypothetical protein BN970_03170 [Mycolicibacterium conceptionense]|uniref:Uncharacterized protein n=1 Tax=Mycolicibacterium conceptionense TaxID=451644 RepID=A0A0U1DFH9_9MYCO|nr:hypothetical protein [Mycolicibacterium conceptionense]ORV20146.1 hypothetical protein AWB98_29965 [Mycolicibacterium conceptionense]CQD15219.1 hypothetical protein BN970_03170 [Mycolicibacterium conceptionense]
MERLLLTLFNGADDTAGEIAAEVRGCNACIGRIAGISLIMYAKMFEHLAGGREQAIREVEQGLAKHLDKLMGASDPNA